MLVAGGTAALNQYIEREMDAVMRRTAARPLPLGVLQPREVLIFGLGTIVAGARGSRLPRMCSPASSPWRLAAVPRPVHSAEDAHPSFDGRRRDSRGAASADRLGRRARIARARRMGALRDSFLLAVPAFHGDRVDISRGLRARGNPHAAGGGSLGRFDVPADRRMSAILVWVSALPSVIGMAGKLTFLARWCWGCCCCKWGSGRIARERTPARNG